VKNKEKTADEIARELRQRLGIDEQRWLDPVTILMKLKREIAGFNYKLVDSKEVFPALAKWDSVSNRILLCGNSFAAANGFRADGRARFSIFHEAVHALRGDEGQFNRLHSRAEIPRFAVKLRRLESGTDQVVAAFMAPRHLIKEEWSPKEVAFYFGMSLESATIRLNEVRGSVRQRRDRPAFISELLFDLDK